MVSIPFYGFFILSLVLFEQNYDITKVVPLSGAAGILFLNISIWLYTSFASLDENALSASA